MEEGSSLAMGPNPVPRAMVGIPLLGQAWCPLLVRLESLDA